MCIKDIVLGWIWKVVYGIFFDICFFVYRFGMCILDDGVFESILVEIL